MLLLAGFAAAGGIRSFLAERVAGAARILAVRLGLNLSRLRYLGGNQAYQAG